MEIRLLHEMSDSSPYAKNPIGARYRSISFDYVIGEYDDGIKLFKKKKLLYLGS